MPYVGDTLLGIDPSGEGKDETVWVCRDRFKAKKACIEKISNEKSIAQKTLTLQDFIGTRDENIYVDNFGKGANVAQEMGIAGHRVNGINVGDKAYDDTRFSNLRAEAYWKLREWLRAGGELVEDDCWKELLYIRYRMTLNGKIQLMPKIDMKKKLGKSPDHADALSLTFIRPARTYQQQIIKKLHRERTKSTYHLKMV